MTLEQFLEALEQTPRDWRLSRKNQIRRKLGGGCQCPITAILDQPLRQVNHICVGLAFTDTSGIQIVRAADDTYPHEPELRAKLLKACGL